MKKEIDQRNKTTLYIPCNCGFHHFLIFDWWASDEKWDDKAEKVNNKITPPKKKHPGWKDYTIAFVDSADAGFWYKIKACWNYLFTKKGEICYSGISINSKDMKKIIEHFNKYMKI